MSKRETILAAALTALAGTAQVSTRIYRSRAEAFDRTEFPALVLEPLNDQPERPMIDRIVWTLTFQVSTLVRNAVPDQAADPILIDVHSKLMTALAAVAGVVDVLAGPVAWEIVPADLTAGIVKQQFQVQYQTEHGSIS